MLTVKSIQYCDNHKFKAVLSSGAEGLFDISPYLEKGIFTELKNVEYCKQVKINFAGIYWPHGQDFSADTIEFHITNQ
jgi:hypothetical protein